MVMRVLAAVMVSSALASLGASVGCGGVNDGPATLDPRPIPDGGPGLSAAFSRQCSRCHGEKGQGTHLSFPRLPGALDEAQFIATVRAGRNDMPAFDPSLISDADLKADYGVLKILDN
jgi:mono/diheme cytochrome c family protein